MFSQVCVCLQGEVGRGRGREGYPGQDRGTSSSPPQPGVPLPPLSPFPPTRTGVAPLLPPPSTSLPSLSQPGQGYPSLPLPQPGPGQLCGVGGMPLAFMQENFLVF